ncbi:hypothetical protein [Microbacterium sp. LWH3-1.2]|uniref:hypothetical protein n=1 Tax=Microbacterium sp. LWH3-1.2 TaxID=3135256 RepID=UPI003432B91B
MTCAPAPGSAEGSDYSLERLFSLDGQVAIVTAGTSGIGGLACAEALAAAGARVLLAGLGDAPAVADPPRRRRREPGLTSPARSSHATMPPIAGPAFPLAGRAGVMRSAGTAASTEEAKAPHPRRRAS